MQILIFRTDHKYPQKIENLEKTVLDQIKIRVKKKQKKKTKKKLIFIFRLSLLFPISVDLQNPLILLGLYILFSGPWFVMMLYFIFFVSEQKITKNDVQIHEHFPPLIVG